MTLDTPISSAGRTFSTYAKKVEKLSIFTLHDLVMHLPSRYEDYSHISSVDAAPNGQTVTIKGVIASKQNVYTRNRLQIQKVELMDDTGTVECVWFNQSYIVKNLHVGDYLSASGRVERFGSKLSMQVKEYEVIPDLSSKTIHTGRLVAVYPETRGVSSKWIRNRVKYVLDSIDKLFDEHLPEQILTSNKFLPITQAVKTIHFPESLDEAENARKRLAYDELFMLQLASIHRKTEWKNKKKTHAFEINKFQTEVDKFYNNLPFKLTNAQKQAISEILIDLSKTTPMNRLLQGDVGSGKTIVAAVGMYISFLNGYQSALMAPTQILAEQHFETLSKLLNPLGINIKLVTSNNKKKKNHEDEEKSDIIIGTHALIQRKVNFENLGFVVIDEQHRFGVHQRGVLRDKGISPHFLSMTATPIPRTVFLTMYGDLDISILDEMPKGRIPIKTWLVPNIKRKNAYKWIEKEILHKDKKGNFNQAFIVCPFIEESENMQSVRAAVKEFEYLKKEVFPKLKLGLLHGKMKAEEKQSILEKFQSGEIHILVSTPVVEVGIDIPNATIIVIEAAERFGLASLHQLRGRVGRNDKQSYCLLFTESESIKTTSRLKSLENTHSGSALAEIDLRQRGAGDMYGTIQHGTRMLKIANFSDSSLIRLSQQDARRIYENIKSYPLLQDRLKSTIIHEKVNPD